MAGIFDWITNPVGSIIGSGIQAIGSLWGGSQEAQAQRETNAMQVDLANTAVQRRAADMKKAGINPLMAAGNPATTPQLAAPTQLGAATKDAARAIGEIPQNVAAMNIQQAQVNQIQAQASLLDAQAKVAQQTAPGKTLAENAQNAATTKNAMVQSDAQTRQQQLDADIKQIQLYVDSGKAESQIQQAKAATTEAINKAMASNQLAPQAEIETRLQQAKVKWANAVGEAEAQKAQATAQMMANELLASNQLRDANIPLAKAAYELNLLTSEAGIKAIDMTIQGATKNAQIASPYIRMLTDTMSALNPYSYVKGSKK